jgi:ribosome maturation factor RimP
MPDAAQLDALKQRLFQLCEGGLSALGYELVELEYLRDPQGWVLRVYIDHPHEPTPGDAPRSTITHDDCEQASRHLGTVLDVEDPIDTPYRLEVSSPGVRRPLRRSRDFARFAGLVVRVQLSQPLDGRKNFTGRILTASDDVVDLEVDGRAVQLPLERIRKAHLEVEL